ncbi:arginine-tRNA-protein transferase 1 [Niveomyces insectorum RCEF 264]|uniref:arginyltransferase n=1 Tax=Niveomyces insectorum RCEF 264 TaxID=1081102 RepID=A0A162JD62_9HYPO|nr:arginine-tRNA-protein transferase 1 [Niveomyces insectorum RCEF 264]
MQSRFSYYASAHSLSPEFYKTLLDRCWRRSGTLLYRPNQRNSCCPHYTIRLDSAGFHATRDQRQAINRFNRFVIGDAYANEAARLHPRSREEAKRRDTTFDLVERVHEAECGNLPPLWPPQPHHGKKHAKKHAGGAATPPPQPQPPPPRPSTTSAPEGSEEKGAEPAHRFEVTLEPDTFTEEKFLLFENYQRLVHKEPPSKITRQGFESFLCGSPLRRETVVDADGHQTKLGSFHQCYRLDGRLVAIGVLDLLPQCVSAVYFLYHESIHQHSPGKLGALREIALAREGGYRWWYSGFYIHSCPKMRYKIDFSPQYVLDPETYAWDALDRDTLGIFDRKPYVSLSKERRLAAQDTLGETGHGRKDAQNPENGRLATARAGEDEDARMRDKGPHTPTPGAGSTKKDDDQGGNRGREDGGHVGAEEAEEEDEEDEDEDEGATANSLLASNMPGLPPLDEVAQYDLDDVPILTPLQPEPFPVKYLVVWDSGDVLDGVSFKAKVAELVAIMGADLLPQLCLDFRPPAS